MKSPWLRNNNPASPILYTYLISTSSLTDHLLRPTLSDELWHPRQHSSTSLKKLLTNRQRGINHSIWSKTFSPVFVWAVLYHQVDHKPLQHLLGEMKRVPAMASARVQRWALTLSAYNYTVQYVPGKDHSNASRLPLPVILKEVPVPEELVYMLEMGKRDIQLVFAEAKLRLKRSPIHNTSQIHAPQLTF